MVINLSAPPSEFCQPFVQGMADRMGMSFYKYGAVKEGAPLTDALKNARTRLAKYEETGNTEWLIDVANFAMIEFMHPQRPDAHYRATDSHESPGRVNAFTNRTTQASNAEIKEGA